MSRGCRIFGFLSLLYSSLHPVQMGIMLPGPADQKNIARKRESTKVCKRILLLIAIQLEHPRSVIP